MNRLAIILMAALAAACTNTVVTSDDDGTGGDGAGNNTGGSGASVNTGGTENVGGSGAAGPCADCPEPNAIVYGESTSGTTSASSGTTTGSGQTATTITTVTTSGAGPGEELVHLQISNYGEACMEAYEILPCGGYTRYTLTLPKSLLVAPSVVQVSQPGVWLTIEETTEPYGQDCGFGFGGGFEEGQLTIDTIASGQLRGSLSGLISWGSYDPNGPVVADLCGL
jgi:hypothetical protein